MNPDYIPYNPEVLREKLTNVFNKYSNISLVYLFGSSVSGNVGPMSDLDIAVLYEENEKLSILNLCELGNKIADILGDENIQVVPLNEQSLSFSFNVINTGICIYGSEEKRVRFETSILNQYLDFKFFADQYNRMFKNQYSGK
ncbi:MAG: nucleotidyltransferase domain-containing protein [Elusimicrobiota bacterium]